MAQRRPRPSAARYVDIYVLPVPKRNIARYRKIASAFARVIRDYDVLEYREFVGEDLRQLPGMSAFGPKFRLKKNETIVAAVVGYRSKAHRTSVNKRIYTDPRLAEMTDMTAFDPKRMVVGGFRLLVSI